jgi:hypothetical protein
MPPPVGLNLDEMCTWLAQSELRRARSYLRRRRVVREIFGAALVVLFCFLFSALVPRPGEPLEALELPCPPPGGPWVELRATQGAPALSCGAAP